MKTSRATPSNSVAMIEVAGLHKRFGKVTVVADLSFEVAAGEALALWGANGAGKTTAIKCLLGLLDYEGRIGINGLDARRHGRDARRQLGYVPQELAFYDDLTTLATAQFYGRLKHVPSTRPHAVLTQVGLADHAGKPVSALSGGMKQRLALALALLADPPVLVLDEPTSNLDTVARDQFLQLLGEVKTSGKTILFTSHRLEEVETLADRALVLEKGQLIAQVPAANLAVTVGLKSRVKLYLPDAALDAALAILQRDGFTASRNGTGIYVDVQPGHKAQPIQALAAAQITVRDFEVV
ncbi:ABC transporter ATP-binding protein [Candidatus Amarolinea aalborgensis]|uniref:ABC transporter ATP-binding protein n=1 Tax=Candidatus Amarolinea aalborgensis TaxID=2249329 RepID=UPI003BF98CD9